MDADDWPVGLLDLLLRSCEAGYEGLVESRLDRHPDDNRTATGPAATFALAQGDDRPIDRRLGDRDLDTERVRSRKGSGRPTRALSLRRKSRRSSRAQGPPPNSGRSGSRSRRCGPRALLPPAAVARPPPPTFRFSSRRRTTFRGRPSQRPVVPCLLRSRSARSTGTCTSSKSSSIPIGRSRSSMNAIRRPPSAHTGAECAGSARGCQEEGARVRTET